jgi:hypothetical protein
MLIDATVSPTSLLPSVTLNSYCSLSSKSCEEIVHVVLKKLS